MRSIHKIFILLLIGIGIYGEARAQHTLLDKPVKSPAERIQKGPNTKYYQSGFWSFGVAISINESDSAQTGSSSIWRYGTRGKWKWNNTFAGVWELAWNRTAYRLEQDSLRNLFAPGVEYDQQKFVWNQLELGVGFRVNIGKRGNYLGNFVDLGAYGEWAFSIRQHIKEDVDPSMAAGAEKVKTTLSRLDYVNPLNYGLTARIGVNKIALWTKYRMSDQFKPSKFVNQGRAYPELTRLQVGVEVTF